MDPGKNGSAIAHCLSNIQRTLWSESQFKHMSQ
jgi:hypothetical protein